MKKKLLYIIPIIFVLLLVGCKKDETNDALKFSEEYTQVDKYNYFVYRNAEEIIKILENGTGVVYLGFPECPWCQTYVKYLNEVADMEGLEKIFYFNILEDRKNNTNNYQKIVKKLNDYLRYDEEGNKKVYVPAIIFVSEGEIIGFDDETSYDTKGFENPNEYWNETAVSELKTRLTNMMTPILNNKCTECNE